jgi:hypothetical protein
MWTKDGPMPSLPLRSSLGLNLGEEPPAGGASSRALTPSFSEQLSRWRVRLWAMSYRFLLVGAAGFEPTTSCV